MKTNLDRFLVLLIFAFLSCPTSEIGFSQTSTSPELRKKKVFSNEDLEKYQEKRGSNTATSQTNLTDTSSKDKTSHQAGNASDKDDKGKLKQDLPAWRTKLKAIDDTIVTKKKMEGKLTDSLSKYSQKLTEADTDFYKLTAKEQVAGVQENLTRTQTELKKAEEEKAKLLSEAKKAGIKEEDLLESESSNTTKK